MKKQLLLFLKKISPQLYHLGYYFKHSYACKETTKVSWRCIVNSCKAGRYTFTETVGIKCDYYIINGKHLEQPDVTKFELLERRRLIKERAANSDDKAGKILSLVEKPHDDHVVVYLPS
ncbi:hypothetical protein BpHYR1_033903 [Brachionus plicatilis]|uniref:FLYWCH-type domain-containing protein n=1 Tax=Brachionus plicatilis TaxID=10195 RepID=A0A3M7PP09_BRAPC|nr:hypothetical protein BpHYR1_033903 [Brachionus plicatilis]